MSHSRLIVVVWIGALVSIGVPKAASQVRNDEAYAAIVSKNQEFLNVALQSGLDPTADVFVPGSDNAIGLLELAIRARNEEAAIRLLEAGAQPSEEMEGQSTPRLLEMVAIQDLPALLQRIIESDPVSLISVSPDQHPLVIAAAHGSIPSLQVLLENVNTIAPLSDREVILERAVGAAMTAPPPVATEILGLLLDAGARTAGAPYLAGAASLCRPDLVTFFLEQGRSPEEVFEGRSAARYALACVVKGNSSAKDRRSAGVEILEALNSAGMDVCNVRRTLGGGESEALMESFGCP